MMKIENVSVKMSDSDATRFYASVGWTDGAGFRYHVWLQKAEVANQNGPIYEPQDDLIYKNPIERNETLHGRLPTKKLDRTNATNAPVWREVWRRVQDGNMIQAAIKALADKHAAEIEAERQGKIADTRRLLQSIADFFGDGWLDLEGAVSLSDERLEQLYERIKLLARKV